MKGIIFDWGGVLMRTLDYTPRFTWDRKLGLMPGTVEQVVHGLPQWREAQLGQIDLATYWQAVAEELSLSPQQTAALRHDFYRGDELDRPLANYIIKLRWQGIPVGLMSNNTLDLNDTIRLLEMEEHFVARVISAEIGVMKPDPEAYYAILDKMELEPEQALFVDDFVKNVEGARQIGMAALCFTPALDLRTEVEAWLALS